MKDGTIEQPDQERGGTPCSANSKRSTIREIRAIALLRKIAAAATDAGVSMFPTVTKERAAEANSSIEQGGEDSNQENPS